MVKYIFFSCVVFFSGCEKNNNFVETNKPIIDDIAGICNIQEPNINLDINRYLPFESSMDNSIKNNLGMKISDFFIGMENSKLLSNMNIYENQGYIDIIDNDYNIKGRILIVSDKDYIKYITLEVASDLKFFKEEVIKKVLVDVVDVLNKKNNGDLIYETALNNLEKNMRQGKFNLRTGVYSGSYEQNKVIFEFSTINNDFIYSKVRNGEIKDINCKTKKYNDYRNLKKTIFSIYKI